MAQNEPGGAGEGLIEWIRFAVDRVSVSKAEREMAEAAAALGRRVESALKREMDGAPIASKFVREFQAKFEAEDVRIKEAVHRGLLDPAGAARAAKLNAEAYNRATMTTLNTLRRNGVSDQENVGILVNGLKTVPAHTSRAREAVDKLNTSVRNTFASMMAWGKYIAIGFGVSALYGIIRTNMEFERLNAQLRTTEKSQEGANRAFAFVERLAIKTPFSIQEMTQAYIRLRTVGIQPTEAMMLRFADFASAWGGDVAGLVVSGTQAAFGETERLKAYGVAAQVRGQQIKLTYADMTRTVGRNAKEVIAFLEDVARVKFEGAAERRMQTIEGRMSNLKDAAGVLARQIGQAGLNKALGDLATNLTRVADSLARGNQVGEFVAKWVAAFKTFWAQLQLLDARAHKVGTTLTRLTAFADIATATATGRPDAVAVAVARWNAAAEADKEASREVERAEGNIERVRLESALDRRNATAEGRIRATGQPGYTGAGEQGDNLDTARRRRATAGTGTPDPKKPVDPAALAAAREKFDAEVKAYQDLAGIAEHMVEAFGKLNAAEDRYRAELAKTTDPVRIAALTNDIKAIRKARFDAINAPTEVVDSTGTGRMETRGGAVNVDTAETDADRKRIGEGAAKESGMSGFAEDMKRTFAEELPYAYQSGAASLVNAFGAAFDKLRKDGGNVGKFLGTLGAGLVKGLLGSLAQVAKGKVVENLAYALEAVAQGFYKKDPSKFVAAKGFAAAAAAWGVAGGVMGGLASAAGGSGGGGDAYGGYSLNRNAGGDAARDSSARGPVTYIYLDGMDPGNPRHQDLAVATYESGKVRSGASTYLMPASTYPGAPLDAPAGSSR